MKNPPQIPLNLVSMAHDLSLPLAFLKNRVGAANTDPTLLEAITRVESQARKIMEWARHSAAAPQPLEQETVKRESSLADSIRKAVVSVQQQTCSTCGIHYDFDEECEVIRAPEVLEHTLRNALFNAIQAGATRITIRAHEIWNSAKVFVLDNGRGIGPGLLEDLGQRPVVSTKESGNGIGLFANVQALKQHNWDVEIFSELGKGTDLVISCDRPMLVD